MLIYANVSLFIPALKKSLNKLMVKESRWKSIKLTSSGSFVRFLETGEKKIVLGER